MADQDLPKEQLLLKMLKMTTSDNDGTALVAIRKANALLTAAGWDWDKLIAGKIKIVPSPFGNIPTPRQAESVARPYSPPPAPPPKPPMPTRSASVGKLWSYDSWTNSWKEVSNPNYRAPAPPPPRNGLGLTRKNLYAHYCYCCGDYVANEAGFIIKPRDFTPSAPDKWFVACKDCNTNKSRSSVHARPAPKNTGQTTVRAPAPGLGDL